MQPITILTNSNEERRSRNIEKKTQGAKKLMKNLHPQENFKSLEEVQTELQKRIDVILPRLQKHIQSDKLTLASNLDGQEAMLGKVHYLFLTILFLFQSTILQAKTEDSTTTNINESGTPTEQYLTYVIVLFFAGVVFKLWFTALTKDANEKEKQQRQQKAQAENLQIAAIVESNAPNLKVIIDATKYHKVPELKETLVALYLNGDDIQNDVDRHIVAYKKKKVK